MNALNQLQHAWSEPQGQQLGQQPGDAGRITTQLGTPRGRYDEYSSKFSLSKKPRFNRIQEKAKLQKVMLTSLLTLQQGRRLRHFLSHCKLPLIEA
jgi:hypothetical protein